MKRKVKKSQFDNINAIRFLAVFAIFLSHSFITNDQQIIASKLYSDLRQVTLNLNSAAFSILFILTGFLNTWAIFEERFIYKTVNVLRLYFRRFLTLLPLYFVLFPIGYYIIPKIVPGISIQNLDLVSAFDYFTFTFNFGHIDNGNPIINVLGNMWVVAAMVHLILVWPLMMHYFRRHETWLFGIGTGIFVIAAWFNYDSDSFQYNTLNVLLDFTAGSFLAYFSFFKYKLYVRLKETTKRTIAFVYLCFFTFIFFRERLIDMIEGDVPEQLIFIAERLLVTATLLYFVFEQNFSQNSLFKLFKLRIFNPPGRISYSIYACHSIGIVIAVLAMQFLNFESGGVGLYVIQPLLAFVISWLLAAFSMEFFEKKFIRRRKNYAPTREYIPVSLNDAPTKPT